MEECSQYGTHPHEFEKPHEADGWMEVRRYRFGPTGQDYKEVFEEFPICWACATQDERWGLPPGRYTTWFFRNSFEEAEGGYRWVKDKPHGAI